MFGRGKWEAAEGRVIDSRVAKVRVSEDSGASITREFVVEVRTAGGETFRATLGPPRSSDFLDPRIGARVGVEIEAKSGKVRFDMADPGLSLKAFERRQKAVFDANRDA